MILTVLIIIPAIGGVLAWVLSRWSALAARWVSLLACAGVFGIAIALWGFSRTVAGPGPFVEQQAPWIPAFGITYHLAMDGLSLLLVALTGLLGMISVACSWKEITRRVGAFHFSLLVLLSAILGVFLAYDLILFYIFWELMLIPMYFLIGVWGHEKRVYAAVKFFIFTFLGGLIMLIAILGLYFQHIRVGPGSFDLPDLMATPMPPAIAFWLMLGFFTAFAVKLPAVPIHSWLPDAHTEAPTAGSVILAGLMLKTGAYGFLRFAIPLFPQASVHFATAAQVIGVVGILYGAGLAFAQSDLKRMVAYTSISHLGFVLLGIYAGTPLALLGAVMGILAHGISTGALFAIAGMIQERTHTREFGKLGGLWATTPKLGGFTLFFALAALGLPGLGNFIAEFLVLLGTFQVNPAMAVVGSLGFVVSVIYALRLVQESVQGPNTHPWKLPDLSAREVATLGILAVIIIWLGIRPQAVFNAAEPSLRIVESSLTQK